MATTPTRSVADRGKAAKTKVTTALDKWRAGLTPEAKAKLAERIRQTQQQRWLNMSERERRDRLAGVKAWQREQRKAKRDAAQAKPEAAPKPNPKTKPARASRATSVGARPPLTRREQAGLDPATGPTKTANRRSRKAVSK